ncbi:ATPase, histidine kinase-, DNA gyrase B-, and HSP90-like domain protein [gamma proteobacterium HTCC5015]|nr:ATPase, histidine kinase-, DNA gyrase B-, and HSP90-like domain protein [gamma proteobacterium HTCC5015]
MNFLSRVYQSQWRNALLALTLFPLLVVAWNWSDSAWINRSLLVVHSALFIVWMPFWLGELQIRMQPSWLLVAICSLVVAIAHPIVTSVWLALVASMVVGEPFQRLLEKTAQTITLSLLAITLFITLIPRSLELSVPPTVEVAAEFLCFGLLVSLLPMLQARKHQNLRQGDIILSLLFFQVLSTVAMASVIIDLYSSIPYFEALLSSLAAVCVAAVLLNLGWRRVTGTGALSFFWKRYLLVLGSPFETVLVKFSALAKTTQSPGDYLKTCFHEMLSLDWLNGVSWHAASGRGDVGELTGYSLDVEIADLSVTLYSDQELHGNLAMHARLLVHLMTHFYHAIKRERSLAHRAHVQAVYETGARLTHDIKNLLQGLQTLAAAGEHSRDPAAFHALFMKQVPHINERLTTTLRKLTEPQQGQRERQLKLSEWWEKLQQSYKGRDIQFSSSIELDAPVPTELFDNVAENLLENARNKRIEQRRLEITVELAANADGVVFSVADNGSPVPSNKVDTLMSEPVTSEFGLGVGLYQAAALAEHQGYRLELETNVPGMVCFSLSKQR